jgi:hypothetical protein
MRSMVEGPLLLLQERGGGGATAALRSLNPPHLRAPRLALLPIP